MKINFCIYIVTGGPSNKTVIETFLGHSSFVCKFGHIILSCIFRILNMLMACIHYKHNLKCIYQYQQLCCTIWIVSGINKDNSEFAYNVYEFRVRLNEN